MKYQGTCCSPSSTHFPGGDGDLSAENTVVRGRDVDVSEAAVGHINGRDARKASGDGRVHQ